MENTEQNAMAFWNRGGFKTAHGTLVAYADGCIAALVPDACPNGGCGVSDVTLSETCHQGRIRGTNECLGARVRLAIAGRLRK